MLSSKFYPLLAYFSLVTSTAAQGSSSNNSTNNVCVEQRERLGPDAPLNSTGKIGFHFSGATSTGSVDSSSDWYFSVTLNETRPHKDNDPRARPEIYQWLQGWLSVPNDASGSACVYSLAGINATATGTGNNGCDGVLSQACITALRNATGSGKNIDAQFCPDFKVTDEMRKQCANPTAGSVIPDDLSWNSKPYDLSNGTCTIPAPPHVSIPDGYRTYFSMSQASFVQTDHNTSSFDWYDIRVQQPTTWVITKWLPTNSDSNTMQYDTQVVCVAPNDVVKGSRTPELHLPQNQNNQSNNNTQSPHNQGGGQGGGHSGSQGISWRAPWKLVLFIAGAASIMSIL